jgi:cathepsin L
MSLKKVLSLAFASTTLAVGKPLPGEHDWSSYTYEQYVKDIVTFRGENSVSEERRAIFNANLRLILEHNANPEKTWHAGPNEFTDWTNEEFRSFRTGSRPDLRALRLGAEHVSVTEAIPDALDWREKKTTTGGRVVTPVKNQGGCGSCWAFSATETFESGYALATGEAAPILSPQQIVSCSPNPDHCGGTGGCQGSTQPLAFNYTETAGLTTEESYPYEGVTGTCQTSKITAVVGKNSGYVQLPTNNYTDLINAVATKGPISISVAAGGMGWQIYFGGIMSGSKNFDMDHAVQLVGYGTDNGKDYWLVRNSWGAGLGEHGYIRLQRFGEGKEPCGTDSTPGDGDACAGDTKPRTYCGECGVLSSSSYPTGITKASSTFQV